MTLLSFHYFLRLIVKLIMTSEKNDYQNIEIGVIILAVSMISDFS